MAPIGTGPHTRVRTGASPAARRGSPSGGLVLVGSRSVQSLSAWPLALAGLVVLAVLSGCDPAGVAAGGQPSAPVGNFRACPEPAGTTPTSAAKAGGASLLPDISLPCMAGGRAVSLRALGEPAVINLWASWCGPCRTELPEFQRLADGADGQVAVLGVVTGDSLTASSSLAADLGVSFPTLFDANSELQRATPPAVLPVTLFVDAGGVVRHVDRSGALGLSTLQDLVRQHLGVALP
jgi:thiol-disulfide isomerase/thioredoxin